MNYVVIDTNIPLSDASNIVRLGQKKGTLVVIPETVLAELDAKKSGFDEINWQARATARLLSSGKVESIARKEFWVETKLNIGGQIVLIVGLHNYTNDPSEYGGNDQRIIQVAKTLTEFTENNVELLSMDFYMRLRALTVGVNAKDLKLVDDAEFEFVKELEIKDPEVFRTLHDSDVYKVDPEYELENYSYKFTDAYSGQVKLATVNNGFIKVLGKDTEKAIRQQDCAPINAEQLLASKALQDPLIDLIMIEGQAGSGKNIVALSNAIKLLRTSKDKYTSIVYLRSPTNDESPGEDIGYVSGNDEKYAMYLGPMEDTVDFIVRQSIKKKSNEKTVEYEQRVDTAIEKLKTDCNMVSLITTGLRGRTLHNCIVIKDEWQNASQATAQKVITRMGKDCKVIVTGSQNQIDSKYVTKYNNGLAVLMNEARERKITTNINMFAIELKKVVRSDMALFGEELFTSKGN